MPVLGSVGREGLPLLLQPRRQQLPANIAQSSSWFQGIIVLSKPFFSSLTFLNSWYGSKLPCLSPHDKLLYLSGDGCREGVDKLDVLGDLEVRQLGGRSHFEFDKT